MENIIDKVKREEEEQLVADINRSTSSDQVVNTVLKTDERVIARVTDGIYRQPASAIRELINNAYDADASRVVIKTDWPRFNSIYVEDNGLGMSPATLAHMLMHIGGSAKRQEIGLELGLTNGGDVNSSPGGRKLIGKIGIGIFSVSQLTHNFQIITKRKDDDYRTIATVALKQYSDEPLVNKDANTTEYESGKVKIWREKADDIEAQGTSIILTSIKPQAKNTLRSTEIWSVIDQNAHEGDTFLVPPKYHIGRVDSRGDFVKLHNGRKFNLPWNNEDDRKTAFEKLVNCVWDEFQHSNPTPKIERLFDYYLRMVWQLGLSIPVPYVCGHLFDMDLSTWSKAFEIANDLKGAAKEITLIPGKPIRELLNLKERDAEDKFEVYFDDILLFRPIKFKDIPYSQTNAIKHPLIFFGKCREEFSKIPVELSSGPIEFEAYLYWNSKIAPVEHRGSLIRIKDASGTLFDSTFMRYQVAELTRLSQITCEIFIREGFDSALNIDRESFNYAHPHSVFLTKWLHNALRQLATAQKRISNEILEEKKEDTHNTTVDSIQQIAVDVWRDETKERTSLPPSITIESGSKLFRDFNADITLNRDKIIPKRSTGDKTNIKSADPILEEKIKAIAQVLISFGLFDNLDENKRDKLMQAIYRILETK